MARLLCACCAVALLCTPAAAQPSRAHLSQDPAVNHARALLHAGRPHAALDILRPLATDPDPAPARADITDIRFLIGLSALAAAQRTRAKNPRDGLLIEAIAALRAILVQRPELTRVRLELARAFFLKGEDGLSRRHFQRVLAGNPPPAMAVNIRRFLHSLRARRRWSSYLTFSLEQNDNINNASGVQTLYIFGLPFEVGEQSRRRAQTGLSLATGFEYQTPLGEGWRWRFGADATRNEYQGHGFDQTYLRLRSGPRWLLSSRSELSLQATFGQRWLARDRHSADAGFRIDARHRLTQRLALNAQAAWEKTRHQRAATPDFTDTDYHLSLTRLFSPLLQGSLGIGHATRHHQDGTRNREPSAHLGLSRILPRGWTVGARWERSRERHGRNALLSSQRRVDDKRITRLFVLNRGLTFYGFSPQLVVARERQQSNSTLSNYRRTRVDVRFVRQF